MKFWFGVLFGISISLPVHGQTLISVKETLAGYNFKDLSSATQSRWEPKDAEQVASELAPLIADPKRGSFKPFREILQHRNQDYVLEELEWDRDGKKIPYYIAYHKNTPANEKSRAIHIGLPAISDYPPGDAVNVAAQKLWLDKGGVVVLSPLVIDDPMTLLSGQDSDKQKLYQRLADQFAGVAEQVLKTKKAGILFLESPKDVLFLGAYTALRHPQVYAKVVFVQPEIPTAVANPVTPPTAKIWPDYLILDWYKNLLAQEWKLRTPSVAKSKPLPGAFIAVDSQNTFAGKMTFGVLHKHGVFIEYLEVSLWSHSDKAAKTARFEALKYNYLLNTAVETYRESQPKSRKKSKSKNKSKTKKSS